MYSSMVSELSDGMDQKFVKIEQSYDEEDMSEGSDTPLLRQSTRQRHPPGHFEVFVAGE